MFILKFRITNLEESDRITLYHSEINSLFNVTENGSMCGGLQYCS